MITVTLCLKVPAKKIITIRKFEGKIQCSCFELSHPDSSQSEYLADSRKVVREKKKLGP